MMIRWIAGLSLALLIACGPIQDQAESTVSMGAPDGFAVLCTSQYTRIVPHYCADIAFDGTQTFVTTISGLGCQSIDVSAFVPMSAKYLYVVVDMKILSSNAIGQRESRIAFNSQASCAAATIDQIYINFREFVATAANTEIYRQYMPAQIPVVNGTVWYVHSTTGNPTIQGFYLIGYFD